MPGSTAQRALVLGTSGSVGTRLVKYLTEASGAVTAVAMPSLRDQVSQAVCVSAVLRQPMVVELGASLEALHNFAAVHRTPRCLTGSTRRRDPSRAAPRWRRHDRL